MFHLKHVEFSIEKTKILSIDDLEIDGRKSLLILGASGSGKTSLLYILSGIHKAQSGEVLYKDVDLRAFSNAERDAFRSRNFGFVFQSFHLLPHLSLSDNIRLAYMSAKIPADENRIGVVLEQLGLLDKAKQKACTLSQGEKQRAAIARAVILSPKVIFADEPTSALDDAHAEKIVELLKEQAVKTNAQLIITTHDSRIKKHFDNVLNLHDGGLSK